MLLKQYRIWSAGMVLDISASVQRQFLCTCVRKKPKPVSASALLTMTTIALPKTEAVKDTLDSIALEYIICFENMDDPKVLVCGHNLCSQCSKKVEKTRNGCRVFVCSSVRSAAS